MTNRTLNLTLALLFISTSIIAGPTDCFIKKESWRESLIDSREALMLVEDKLDQEALAKTNVKVGDWYYLAAGKDFDHIIRNLPEEIRNVKNIDLSKPVTAGGKTSNWVKIPSLTPGTMYNTLEIADGSETKQLLLCTTISIPASDKIIRHAISASTDNGYIQTKERRVNTTANLRHYKILNDVYLNIPPKEGTHHVLIYLDLRNNTHNYFQYQLRVMDKSQQMDQTQRVSRRNELQNRIKDEFKDPLSQMEMEFEPRGHISSLTTDWTPRQHSVIAHYYRDKTRNLLPAFNKRIASADPEFIKTIEPLIKKVKTENDDSWRAQANNFSLLNILDEAAKTSSRFNSMKMAVEDQMKRFKEKYPNGPKHLKEINLTKKDFTAWYKSDLLNNKNARNRFASMYFSFKESQKRILLDNPLLKFERLLIATGGVGLSNNWSGPNRIGNKLQVLSPVSPSGILTTIHQGNISSYELDWDAKKILFSDGVSIFEMDVDGKNLRTIKGRSKEDPHRRYNPCRLPDGNIMFVSTAACQAVPCTGQPEVGNMHLMDKNGENERRLTFDQDHNWDPFVLNNGRVIYMRWEYTDTPHYFTRILMSMNPDGTDQKEYYGSSSYWPNSMFWPQPIPGHPTKFVTIVSGHHGTARAGELIIFDPSKGRHEADGVVQRIPGYGEKVEPIIQDRLVDNTWPKFITPHPLGTSEQEDGAGTYFLVSVKESSSASWKVCLADIFDNITPIIDLPSIAMPVPVLPRKKPLVLAPRINLEKKTGTAMIMDIYEGPGLKGFPKGSIKSLRVGTYHFRYPGNGDTYASSHEGSWDIRKILGTVPVQKDGSAFFEIPASTPIFVQPLDAEGQALQVMRSWFTAQPGENLTCIGCHESQNLAPPSKPGIASRKRISKIEPWKGPTRGFSFDREVQPVLDRKCAGCHNGNNPNMPDFRAKSLHKDYKDKYSPAYMAMQKYVRRAGYENDYHVPVPGEWQADTSHAIKLLKKGHHNVRLNRDEWDRLYTWIDFNIPYPATWQESHQPPQEHLVKEREKFLELYAGIVDTPEAARPIPQIAQFEPPTERKNSAKPISVEGWPFEPKANEEAPLKLDLGNGIEIDLVKIPAGNFVMGEPNGFEDEQVREAKVKKPFYMGTTEISLKQYNQFDPNHENGFIANRRKDKTTRGDFCMDQPDLPVVRISLDQAKAFCEWLSKKTGKNVSLPTETEWEWACRAGSDGRFIHTKDNQITEANICDENVKNWNFGRCEPRYNDYIKFVAHVKALKPNAWGLYNMLGNVAEWTDSDYKLLPDMGEAAGARKIPYKVIRGGSWNDTARFATMSARWRYPAYQPVHDIGFRVIVRD